jgi:hypothetical protein
MAPAAATTVNATTTTVEAAAGLMSDAAAVIELRMMAVAVMFFPRMVDAEAGIAPAPPTPVWRIAVFWVAIAATINRKASARGAGDYSKQNECSDRADRDKGSLLL